MRAINGGTQGREAVRYAGMHSPSGKGTWRAELREAVDVALFCSNRCWACDQRRRALEDARNSIIVEIEYV
jgi:hypothetical protein